MPAQNLKYKVIYKINHYSLNYDLNTPVDIVNVSNKPASVSYTIKTNTFAVNGEVTSESHNFLGWFDAKTGGKLVTDVAKGTNKDITVYAHWSKKSITTNFDPNGGNISEEDKTKTNDYGTELTLPSVSKSYSLSYKIENNKPDGTETAALTLVGWCKEASSCSNPITPNSTIKAETNATYYALWSNDSATKTIKGGQSYSDKTTVYTFTKWILAENTLGYTKTDYIKDDTITLLGDTTLKALYENSARKYNLTINYLYKDNSIAFNPYSEDVANGLSYSVNSPVIKGYTADLITVSGIMPAEQTTRTVIYSPNNNTPYKVLFYKDGVLQTNDTLILLGTTNSNVNYTAESNKYANYKIDSSASNILSGTITADGSLELKVYYVKKLSDISVNVTKTLNRVDSSYKDNTLATNDLITYKITVKNNGEGSGTINVKDILIKEAIASGIVSVNNDKANIANYVFSDSGYDVNINGKETITYTITLKVTGKAGDTINSQLITKEDQTVINKNKDTYAVETKVEINEISDKAASVVLVLDNSGSMIENNKLESMKTAAKSFVNSILGENKNPNNEVCIVVMPDNSWQSADTKCSNIASTLTDYIDKPNNLDGSGWTPYTAALNGANSMLDNLKENHANNSAYTIFLTDGEPVIGRSLLYPFDHVYDKGYDEVASSIRNKSTLYTIGYEISDNENAKNILKGIASTGKAKLAGTNTIKDVLGEISKVINGEAKETTKGVLSISSKIDTTKNITIKVNNTLINKTLSEAISLGYIINQNGTYQFNASKFNAGDKLVLTYYVKD